MTKLTLEAKWPENGTVTSFSFTADRPVRYEAGQYAHFLKPSVLARLAKPQREFSIASAPNDRDIRITTDLSSATAFKKKLSSLKKGDHILLHGVEGNMTIPKDAHGTYVFIAGGIGITPFRSLLRDIEQRNLQVVPILIHVGNPPFLYQYEFEDKPFEQHRINRSDMARILTDASALHKDAHYFIAGSGAFIRATVGKLQERGVPNAMIVTDEFEGLKDTETQKDLTTI